MRLRESARAMAGRSSAEILSGRYRLDGLLGSGGAAEVHRGFDLKLRRPVAVKVFRPDTGFGAGEDLHGEAVILARLHHPGLVTAYDAGQHDGRAFLVMQLVEGSTLKNLIAAGPLSPGATAALGADLARALAHAHDAGIVHRDVKPSNILLDAALRPYLTDFGISRLLDATTRTATGTLVGTAAYLSPEQVLGQPVGRPADVYALGLVLLECLTGRLEYDGGPLEAAIARLHRQPVLPSSLPEQLADLLRDMTALDEQTRPTAHDCARLLAASAGTVRPAAVPPELATSLVAHHEALETVDRTHMKPLPPVRLREETSGAAPGRGRVLAVGATAALAAVVVTAFGVSDGSRPQDDGPSATRASTAPAPEADPSDGAARQEEGSASGAVPSPDRSSASPGTSSGAASAYSVRPSAAAPDRRSAVDTAPEAPVTPDGTAAPAAVAQEGTTTKTPRQPPGLAKKAEKVKNKDSDKDKGQNGNSGSNGSNGNNGENGRTAAER
ncbi:serine/threonine-protein kinase [Streptomyces beigongshangae]|uniref:serine/threonine-protein kinase n=1 Tax=Streptomyces beigongshangae TaxID=2841597 RepID=UPI0021A3D889|nr:serine/threonine-protein kinase [Streptomyces sp. REN17]